MAWVYFIQAGAEGPIKIGSADDPDMRLAILQVGNHESLTLLARAPGGISYERELHSRFAASRIRGEWFEASTDGLTEAITEALHFETLLQIHGAEVCKECGRRPVVPPRQTFCSEDCAKDDARRRSRDWRRRARRAS